MDVRAGKKHRRHRNRVEADRLAAEYEASQLSREEFCQQKDVPLVTLSRYVARYRKRPTVSNGPQRLIAVEVTAPGGRDCELSVVLSHDRRIEVRRGFDVATLRQLVVVLEQV